MPVVPHQFLFRFTIPVKSAEHGTGTSRHFLNLDETVPLPNFGPLDDVTAFATIRAGWDEAGIGFRVEVAGKKMPTTEVPNDPGESDGFQVWLDTRNTQTIHRASRFCHRFAFLPGERGSKNTLAASGHQLAISLAKEDPPFNKAGLLRVGARTTPGGYVLDAWIPAEALVGYDPESNPMLGFYYVVRDTELGEQFLGVGRDFPFDHDPSLWSTLELVR
jgi:hypothetical protein